MSNKVECALYKSLTKAIIRMTSECERLFVGLGSKSCKHFLVDPSEKFQDPKEVTDICRRTTAARNAPPVETYITVT